MAMKKVLCHINNMCRGGAERVMSVLIDAMVNDGMHVVLVTLNRATDEYEVPEYVKRIELDDRIVESNKITRFPKRVAALRDVILQEHPDVVLSFCSKENYRSALAMTGIDIPLVVSVRSNPVEHYGGHPLFTKYMSRRVDGCVFQSQTAREYFDTKLQAKSAVITNPINKSYFDVKADLSSHDDNDIRVVTAGRLSSEKNQSLLAEAFSLLAQKYPQTHLYLYGKDDQDGTSAAIRDIMEADKLEDRIHIMGPTDALAGELVNADIFVLPSRFEGMPNALMEAMAVGLPVISTDCPCGGPATLIQEGENGMLVPVDDAQAMADAMEKLIVDKNMRIKLGTNALAVRELANTDKVYEQWKQYMESLIKK